MPYLDAGVHRHHRHQGRAEPRFINDLCLEYPGHIIVGLDARMDGWRSTVGPSVNTTLSTWRRVRALWRRAIVYTDISRDGMMQGVNVDATVRFAPAIGIR